MGYTGKGVTVAIMDDGLDYLHPDLRDNYVSMTYPMKYYVKFGDVGLIVSGNKFFVKL